MITEKTTAAQRFGKALMEERNASGISVMNLIRKIPGLNSAFYLEVRMGSGEASPELRQQIANALGVTREYLETAY